MIKAPRLMPGDTVATISLSWGGAHTFPQRYAAGKRQLQQLLDVQVVETRHALRDAAWLERNPQARAEDLMEAFADPSIAAIISNIGGEESIRLLPYLDFALIRQNPKIFMGYSDTTVTHFACLHAGLVSFYGPAILAGFAENGGVFPYTAAALRRALCSAEPIGLVEPNTQGWTVERSDWADPALQERPRTLQPTDGWRWLQGQGLARGPLIGGCVEVLDWLRGTSVWPDLAVWQDAILFLETSEEAPPPIAIERILRALAAVGVLGRIGALLFGRPGGELSEAQRRVYDTMLLKVVAGEYGRSELPIVTNMDFGHTDPMMVLPYGIQAQVDCERRAFSILEGAVRER